MSKTTDEKTADVLDSVTSAGGLIEDVTVREDGTVDVSLHEGGDVTTSGAGLIIKGPEDD